MADQAAAIPKCERCGERGGDNAMMPGCMHGNLCDACVLAVEPEEFERIAWEAGKKAGESIAAGAWIGAEDIDRAADLALEEGVDVMTAQDAGCERYFAAMLRGLRGESRPDASA